MNLPVEVCRNHPEVLAGWRCTSCGSVFCDTCAKVIPVGPASIRTCGSCGERCDPISAVAEAVQEEKKARRPRDFYRCLPGAFVYPFKGAGIFLLIIGGLFFGGLRFVRFLYSGIFGILISIAVTGYLNAFMLSIISSSAMGEDELPNWPGVADFFEDLVRPYFLVLGVLAFSVFPLIVFAGAAWHFDLDREIVVPGLITLAGLAAIYYPMGLLAVAMFDTASALSPAIIMPSIFKAPMAYLVACLVLALVLAARVAGAVFFAKIPVAGFVFDGLFAFYFLIVGMRILGLLYYANKERFGWFKTLSYAD
jgi:hypothetical protein